VIASVFTVFVSSTWLPLVITYIIYSTTATPHIVERINIPWLCHHDLHRGVEGPDVFTKIIIVFLWITDRVIEGPQQSTREVWEGSHGGTRDGRGSTQGVFGEKVPASKSETTLKVA
jgi:hypothetical protein